MRMGVGDQSTIISAGPDAAGNLSAASAWHCKIGQESKTEINFNLRVAVRLVIFLPQADVPCQLRR